MKQVALICFGFCLSCLSMAQSQAPDSNKQNNNAWVEPMDKYIQLRLSQTSDIEKLAVVAKGSSNNSQYISPNTSSVTHLELSYKFLSFGYSYSAKFLPGNDDDNIRGSTKNGGFNLNFTFSKWQQSLRYNRTTGYYLENTKDYNPAWKEGDPYFQVPQLRLTSFSGLTAYKFNPRYSIAAVATQSARQLRSAGSFIPSLFYRYYILDDRAPITGNLTKFKSNNFEALLGLGYFHTFVLNKSFYAGLAATPSAGFISTKYFARTASQTTESSATNFIFRWEVRGGIGYNGERFFSGAYLRAFGAANKQHPGSSAVNTDARTTFQLFVGYRLRAPKWLKKNVEKVQSVIPGK